MSHKRFTVFRYGERCFTASTYDELFSTIAADHRRSQKAAGFSMTRYVDFIDPVKDLVRDVPHYSGYAIVDNHEVLDVQVSAYR